VKTKAGRQDRVGSRGQTQARFHPTRLETRTEESSAYASRGWHSKPVGVSESETGGTSLTRARRTPRARVGAPRAIALGPERW